MADRSVKRASACLAATLLVALAMAPAARADALSDAARAYASGHYARASWEVRPRAERGDPRAETFLGVMYLRGQGVPQNYEISAGWLRLGARQGEATAQYMLGLLYDRGLGLPQDSVLALAWIDLAVAHDESARHFGWAQVRDAIAGKITRAQRSEAQRLAVEWREGAAQD